MQAVVFTIPEAIRLSLDEFHFPVEDFGHPVVLRESEHPGDLLFPRVQRVPSELMGLNGLRIRNVSHLPNMEVASEIG